MKKVIIVGAVAFAFVFATKASAHVSVNPKEAVVGFNTLVVRVPNEKDVSTVAVRLVVPEGVEVHGIKPVPSWTYATRHEEKAEEVMTEEDSAMEKEESDEHGEEARIAEITWTGRVGAGEFQEFPISVRYAGDPTTLVWKAYQTYAGGEVVPWDDTDEAHPAPKVEMLAEAPVESLAKTVEGMNAQTPIGVTPQQTPLLSVAALILSVAALGVSLKKTGQEKK